MTKAEFFDYKMEGLKELDKVMKEFPNKFTKDTMRSTLRFLAKPLVKDLQAAAPKDTGETAKNIKVRGLKSGSRGAAITIGLAREHSKAAFIEFGTKFIQATPWFRNTWANHQTRILNDYAKIMLKKIESTAKRLMKQAYAGKLTAAGRKSLGI